MSRSALVVLRRHGRECQTQSLPSRLSVPNAMTAARNATIRSEKMIDSTVSHLLIGLEARWNSDPHWWSSQRPARMKPRPSASRTLWCEGGASREREASARNASWRALVISSMKSGCMTVSFLIPGPPRGKACRVTGVNGILVSVTCQVQ